MSEDLKNIIKNLPNQPGVYRYYDSEGQLLYVGKAKNLKNRVSSYFQNSKDHHPRTKLMVSQISRIEYTICKTESESLLLEANLINSLQPKYNIALKEDKNYCYIKLTKNQIPGFFVTKHKDDTTSEYFGPFFNRFVAEATLHTLRSIFPFCQCKTSQTRPCNYVGIGLCEGICVDRENWDSYLERIEQIKKALQGKLGEVEVFLNQKIQYFVEKEDFRQATVWKERLILLRKILASKRSLLSSPYTIDLVTLVIQKNQESCHLGSIFIEHIREGKVVNVANYLLSGGEIETNINQDAVDSEQNLSEKFLSRFLVDYYSLKEIDAPVLVQVFETEDN